MKQLIRRSMMVMLALALALGAWGGMPVGRVAAATCTSAGTGNWSATGTWTGCGGGVPANNDDVVIAAGHTVTVDASTNSLASLTVNGTLTVGNDATARTIAVTGNVTIASGGSIAAGATTATHVMTIGGDLTNNGTFDGLPGAGRIINVTFDNSTADQTISGTGPILTKFNTITLNKGASTRKVFASIDVTVSGGTNCFTWTNGTWEQTAGRLTISSGNQAITANGGLILSTSGSATFPFSITGAGGTGGLAGTLVVNTSGDLTMGSGNNRLEIQTPGAATFTSGTVNIFGRLTLTSGNITINGATIKIDPRAANNLGVSSNVFEAAAAVNLTMSSGSVTIVDPLLATGTGREIRLVSGTGTKTFSGGTIYLGDGSSNTQGSTDGFEVVTDGITLYNFVVNNQQSGANRTVNLGNVQGTSAASHLTLDGSLTIDTGGTLNANVGSGSNVTLKGNWTNNDVFNAGTGTVTFNGATEQTIGGSSATTFNNLTVNSGATVVVPTNVTVTGAVTNNGAMKQTRTVDSATVPFLNISTDKYYGVDISTTGDMGATTVTVWGNQTCLGVTTSTVERCFDITPTTAQQADIKFYYREAEENSQAAAKIWHFSSSNWVAATNITRGGSGEGKWVQGTVSTFSPFVLSNNHPTAVDLADFSAAWQGDAIHVTWETAQELDNLGFNLYRGAGATGPWVKLNGTLIPTQNPGAVFGAVYEWLDAGATPGATVFYRLEDVNIHGVSTFHGPVSATPAGPSAVTLAAFGGRGPVLGLALALAAALGTLGLARKRRR